MTHLPKSPFDPTAQDLDSKIVVALERLSEAFRVALWQESKGLGLSPIQIQILVFLFFHRDERRKVSYLAREFNLTKPTISDAVKALEQKGFLQKTTESHDTRSYVMHLTEAGKALAERNAEFASPFRTAVAGLKPDAKGPLYENLIALMGQLNQAGLISMQRMCFTCRFYRYDEGAHEHFCSLLNLQLEGSHLRVDCPEHEALV